MARRKKLEFEEFFRRSIHKHKLDTHTFGVYARDGSGNTFRLEIPIETVMERITEFVMPSYEARIETTYTP